MKILIACEESQEVTKAFRNKGHEAYSCDIQDCSGGKPEWHIQADILTQLNKPWDIIIAHPPCTRLCNSGVSWLHKRNLWQDMHKAAEFFNIFRLIGRMGQKIAIENPIPHKYAKQLIGYPTQTIQPWQHGHGEQKATCLWLYNLPKLIPTNIVTGREQKLNNLWPSPNRAKLRSKTYEGIAKAMAEQWG